MIRTLMYLPLFLFAATPLVYSGGSINSNDSQTLILYWENDIFANTDGRAVLQNIFLDGNTFTDSHEGDKKPFVADIMAGASLNIKNFRLSYTHVFRTKEFDEQEEDQIFGSISLACIF